MMNTRVVVALLVVLLSTSGVGHAAQGPWFDARVLFEPLAGKWAVFTDPVIDTTSWVGKSAEAQHDFTFEAVGALRRSVARSFALHELDLSDGEVTTYDDGAALVEFRQRFEGEEVAEAGISLNFNPAGKVIFISEALAAPPLDAVKPPVPDDVDAFVRTALSRDPAIAARAITIEKVNGPLLVAHEGRMEWALEVSVQLPPSASAPPALLDIFIAISTGDILSVFDAIHAQSRHMADVFVRTPLDDCTKTEYDSITPAFRPTEIELKRLAANATVAKGDYAQFDDLDGSPNANWTACPAGTCDFHFEWRTQQFAEINTYFHIDEVQDYIQRLGFTLAKRPIKVDVVAIVGNAIALYRNKPAGAGELWFGTGRSTHAAAADGKAVVHEYAHALQAAQVKKLLDKQVEAQGIAEGFADFLALAWFAGRETASCREHVAAFMNGGPGFRKVSMATTYNPATNPTDRHDLGLIWMKALWLTLDALRTKTGSWETARDIVLRGVLLGHRLYGKKLKSPYMPSAALATLAAVKADKGQTDRYFDDFCTGFTLQTILSASDCAKMKNLPLSIPVGALTSYGR